MTEYDETFIDTVVVHKFKTDKEYDDFCLTAQFADDKAKFAKLIKPTNLTEIFTE